MNDAKSLWKRYIVPDFSRAFVVRLLCAVIFTSAFFAVFRPCIISGNSMEPAWKDGGVTLVFRWRYAFREPERGDVVAIRYFGKNYLFKRILALPGDRVGFRNGKLLINGEELDEPYVVKPCNWNTGVITVREGHCFVAGDNREQDILEHVHGEIPMERISGGPLF